MRENELFLDATVISGFIFPADEERLIVLLIRNPGEGEDSEES